MDIPSDMLEWPGGVPVPLVERKHAVAPRSTLTEMESSRIRVRREHLLEIEAIHVTWHMTEEQHVAFQNFFTADLLNGELPFFMLTEDFPVDAITERHTTRILAFMDGQYTTQHSDNLYVVTALLEVVDSESLDISIS